MPKTNSNDDQFLFLISCIRHSNNGRINFEGVAQETGICTKGAAAKRYERMMKAHGIHQPQGPTGRDTGVQPLKSKSDPASSKPPAKKRKRASSTKKSKSVSPAATPNDGDEEAQESKIKTEPAAASTIALKNETSPNHEFAWVAEDEGNVGGGSEELNAFNGGFDNAFDNPFDVPSYDAMNPLMPYGEYNGYMRGGI